jgi:hypothetical protein
VPAFPHILASLTNEWTAFSILLLAGSFTYHQQFNGAFTIKMQLAVDDVLPL